MNDPKIFDALLTQFGFGGLLLVAVYLIARKLASQYENRFSDALNKQALQIAELSDLQTKRVEKLEALSFDALRDEAMQAINTTIYHSL